MMLANWKLNDLQFKGERNYAHGTDLINLLTASLQQQFDTATLDSFKIKFQQSLSTVPEVHLFEGRSSDENKANIASFECKIKGQAFSGKLVSTNEPILNRYDYDEKKLSADMSFQDQSAQLQADPKLTEIEALVLMNKKLVDRLFADFAGKWWFAQADFLNFNTNKPWQGGKVTMTKSFGPSLTISECFLNHDYTSLGTIAFVGKNE